MRQIFRKMCEKTNNSVAFFCKRGCNRSATICAAGVVVLTGWGVEEVVTHMRAVRPGIGLSTPDTYGGNTIPPIDWLTRSEGTLLRLRQDLQMDMKAILPATLRATPQDWDAAARRCVKKWQERHGK